VVLRGGACSVISAVLLMFPWSLPGRTCAGGAEATVAAAAAAGDAGGPAGPGTPRAVRLDVRESSWSAGPTQGTTETLVRTSVSGPRRRIENELLGVPDSLARAARYVQIDRLDRDSSYFFRPAEGAYLPVAIATQRANNLSKAEAMRRARLDGSAPRDTIAPVTVRELGGGRTIVGIACRAVLVELRFQFPDTTVAGGFLNGVLSDTVWLAPPDSPVAELARFERDLSHATAADSFLAAGNALQLAQARGQGLVAVVGRTLRGLPGYALGSHFVNLLYGLPGKLAGIPRQADGAVVIQRTVREAVALSTDALPPGQFELPPGLRRVERGAPATGAPARGAPGAPGGSGGR
jgi:hypothetical protein